MNAQIPIKTSKQTGPVTLAERDSIIKSKYKIYSKLQFWDWYTIQYTVISKGHYYISATYRNWFLADNVCIDKKATRFCSLNAFEIHILLKSFLLCHTPRNCTRFPTAEYTTHTHTHAHLLYICTEGVLCVCTVRWFTSEPASRHLSQA